MCESLCRRCFAIAEPGAEDLAILGESCGTREALTFGVRAREAADVASEGDADGGLAHPIDLDEHGQPVAAPDYAWTGTAWNGGSKDPLKSCAGWTSSIITEKELRGWAAQDTIEWTEAINFGEAACHKSGHIYCLQQ